MGVIELHKHRHLETELELEHEYVIIHRDVYDELIKLLLVLKEKETCDVT
jgi:hypothetical protein